MRHMVISIISNPRMDKFELPVIRLDGNILYVETFAAHMCGGEFYTNAGPSQEDHSRIKYVNLGISAAYVLSEELPIVLDFISRNYGVVFDPRHLLSKHGSFLQ